MTKLRLNALLLIIISISAVAQDIEPSKYKFFSQYSPEQKTLIKNNWGQYFKEDLLTSLNAGPNFFPVKFDSYGSIYPSGELLKDVSAMEFAGKRNDIDNFKYSIYDLIMRRYYPFQSSLKTLSNSEEIDALKFIEKEIEFDFTDKDVNSFYEKWDAYYNKILVRQIKAKLDSGRYNQVIFFIHGYNVPYSLANIQNIVINNTVNGLISKGEVKASKILYVPIFWPSNAQKKCEIESQATFDLSDDKDNSEGIKNGVRFLYYSNRAYYAGITLRNIINDLTSLYQKEAQVSPKIKIFSHSLGAVVATTALINTYSRMQSKYVNYMYQEEIDEKTLGEFELRDPVAFDLFSRLKKTKLPDAKISIFLSAASVPGENTFVDIDSASTTNKKYFVCINTEDRMLTKRAIKLAGHKIPRLSARNMNASSLGCDYLGEVDRTKACFKFYSLGKNIISAPVSKKADHDILTYIQQEDYLKFLTLFINE